MSPELSALEGMFWQFTVSNFHTKQKTKILPLKLYMFADIFLG